MRYTLFIHYCLYMIYVQIFLSLKSNLAAAAAAAEEEEEEEEEEDEEATTAVSITMTLFHFFNCAALTFGPHVVYYTATPL